jgi:acetoin reductase-like protein
LKFKDDEVAIVTGAGKGIGRGIAIRLAKEGCNVVVSDIDFRVAEETADEIRKMGRESIPIRTDVGKNREVKEMVNMTIEKFGKIDILINNAGIAMQAPVIELEEEIWDKIMNVNLKSVFLCCKTVAPFMIEKSKGKIINVTSKVGKLGGRWLSAYSASKAGAISFTQSLARELAPYRINVNAICVGIVFTDLWKSLKERHAEKLGIRIEDVDGYYIKQIPLGRPAVPEDVANVVVFLSSSESDYMTGQAINVTGGQEMR